MAEIQVQTQRCTGRCGKKTIYPLFGHANLNTKRSSQRMKRQRVEVRRKSVSSQEMLTAGLNKKCPHQGWTWWSFEKKKGEQSEQKKAFTPFWKKKALLVSTLAKQALRHWGTGVGASNRPADEDCSQLRLSSANAWYTSTPSGQIGKKRKPQGHSQPWHITG